MKAPAVLFPILALVAGGVAPASAQGGGEGFLFSPPSMIVNVHGGFSRPDTGSDLFAYVTELLTLGRDDFQSFAAGGTLSIPLSSRVDATLAATYSGRTRASEFRDWVDNEELPIVQSTTFTRVPVTAGAKLHLLPRGRSVGSFAWIPQRYAPYVGASAGAVWYRFRQNGDFVDFNDLTVFGDQLESNGWAPAANAVAGIEISLSPRIAVTTEAGYLWSKAKLQRDFQDFDDLDLSGFSATAGISVRL